MPEPDSYMPERWKLANLEIETSETDPKVGFDETGFWITDNDGDKIVWISPNSVLIGVGGASNLDTFINGPANVIRRADGGGAPGFRAIDADNDLITGNGAGSRQKVITHSLGRTPIHVSITPKDSNFIPAVVAKDADDFTLELRHRGGTNWSSTQGFTWAAYG